MENDKKNVLKTQLVRTCQNWDIPDDSKRIIQTELIQSMQSLQTLLRVSMEQSIPTQKRTFLKGLKKKKTPDA